MSGYVYSSEHEREQTQKYEGVYTAEEAALNKKLKEEWYKEEIDFSAVEALLKQGADPLGGTAAGGFKILDHVYSEIICDSQKNNSADLPEITKLFLKYGMDVDRPRVPYDGMDSLNPLWCFTFVLNENAANALKMLLDHGLSAESFAEFGDHTMFDFYIIDTDPEHNEYDNDVCTRAFKMFLLGASYDHVFNADEKFREFLCCSYNTGDIHIFRNWNDFEYRFDTSSCEKKPELRGSVVHIFSKKTGEEVWTIGLGETGRKALEENIKRKNESNP